MESPKQWVFAYQHNVFDVGNFDKVDGHNHYNMVVGNRFVNAIAHYLQRLVAQVLDMISGMGVDEFEPALVVGPVAVVQY